MRTRDAVTVFAVTAVLYLTSNHFHIFTPRLLPTSRVDEAIPFLPHTIWIYISEYAYFGFIYFELRRCRRSHEFGHPFLSLQLFSVSIFWLWPTIYPRDRFPLPGHIDSLTYHVFAALRRVDSPANCCPSLHVSSVYFLSFYLLGENRRTFAVFFTWATAIALSTLTTKQHYVIDVIAGFVLAVIFYIAQPAKMWRDEQQEPLLARTTDRAAGHRREHFDRRSGR